MTSSRTWSRRSDEIPIGLGLYCYQATQGSSPAEACADTELVLPVGEATPENLPAVLDPLEPNGQTPIGAPFDTPEMEPGVQYVDEVRGGETVFDGIADLGPGDTFDVRQMRSRIQLVVPPAVT